jgi:LysR family transcriptional regulator, transcriptional activator of the cysJI operon
MQLLTLKIFCDLVETGSFSQAAELNDITQSAVSQQIRVLEQKYAVSFFERGGKKFSITPEGEVFARASREMLDTYDSISVRLDTMKGVVAGLLRISTVYSIGLHELPLPLKNFREGHPDVRVQVQFKHSQEVYDDVVENRCDLGLVAYPQSGRGVISDTFDDDEMVVIVSPEHRLAKKKRIKLKELNDEVFVTYGPETATRKAIDRLFKQHPITFAQQHEFDTIETVKRAVEVAGVVSIVPRRTIHEEVLAGTLAYLKMEDATLMRPLGILRKQGNLTTPAMREFMQELMTVSSR